LHWLDHTLSELDIVLLMSVNPGYGGQNFIPQVLEKVRSVRQRVDAGKLQTRIEIDGGVSAKNIQAIAAAGADTFVAGSAIYNCDNYKVAIDGMRAELAQA